MGGISFEVHETRMAALKAEIERLRALVKLASDAYENGGEDDCCVACMEIAKAVAAEQEADGGKK